MAEIKLGKETKEWKLFQDYWKLCQKYWGVETKDSYWDSFKMDAEKFIEVHGERGKENLARDLVMALSNQLERRLKEDALSSVEFPMC